MGMHLLAAKLGAMYLAVIYILRKGTLGSKQFKILACTSS